MGLAGASGSASPEVPPERWGRGRGRGGLVVWLLSSGVLLWLAAPSWPEQVDDLFITLAYAWEWWTSGSLVWSSGERVEGYSNFLLLALLTAAVPLGVDLVLVAKGLSLGAALGILAVAARQLPAPASWTGAGTLLALASWRPLHHWAAMGMEAPLAALLAGSGWLLVLRSRAGWGWGLSLLGLFSLTRPEGLALVVLGLGARWRYPRAWGRPEGLALLSLLGLALYHGLRVAWFGALLPTPFLVKLQGPMGEGIQAGILQVRGELISSVGLWLAALAAAGAPRWRDVPWILAPLVLEVGLLLQANGDWMGEGRLLLVGVIASLLAWLASCRPVVPPRWGAGAVSVAVLWSLCVLPPLPSTTATTVRLPWPSWSGGPLSAYGAPLETPLADEVAFLVEQAPDRALVLTAAVGVVGHIPRLTVQDSVGLTHRRAAVLAASGASFDRTLEVLVRDASPHPSLVRFFWVGEPGTERLPVWMTTRYHLRHRIQTPPDLIVDWWSAAAAAAVVEPLPPSLVVLRWQGLWARFPSHPLFCRHLVLALAEADDLSGAMAQDARCAARWPGHRWFGDVPASVSFPTAPSRRDGVRGRGIGLYWNSTILSRPIQPEELAALRVHLDVDAPGEAGAEALWVWRTPCGSVAPPPLHIFSPTTLPVPAAVLACDRPGARRLSIQFANDQHGPEGHEDRNLYAELRVP